eukprot:1538861-Amphidinium_carterae.1
MSSFWWRWKWMPSATSYTTVEDRFDSCPSSIDDVDGCLKADAHQVGILQKYVVVQDLLKGVNDIYELGEVEVTKDCLPDICGKVKEQAGSTLYTLLYKVEDSVVWLTDSHLRDVHLCAMDDDVWLSVTFAIAEGVRTRSNILADVVVADEVMEVEVLDDMVVADEVMEEEVLDDVVVANEVMEEEVLDVDVESVLVVLCALDDKEDHIANIDNVEKAAKARFAMAALS